MSTPTALAEAEAAYEAAAEALFEAEEAYAKAFDDAFRADKYLPPQQANPWLMAAYAAQEAVFRAEVAEDKALATLYDLKGRPDMAAHHRRQAALSTYAWPEYHATRLREPWGR